MTQIMLIDDDLAITTALEALLEEMQFASSAFTNAEDALAELKKNKAQYQLILCDFLMPTLNGLEFMKKLNELKIDTPIILMTAHGNVEIAIEAMQLGAYDYLTKPLNFKELSILIKRALRFDSIQRDYRKLESKLQDLHGLTSDFVGKSKEIQDVFTIIKKVAKTPASIMIKGETGTGKEIAARAIHQLSQRKDKPFVAINCAAIPENLLESELFGHVKGSFTGATQNKLGLIHEANEGTLFLDEIGDMPINLQSKLLRVVQEGKIRKVGSNTEDSVDVRIISATHKNIHEQIEKQLFREDLFFRLNVVSIRLPSLRERSSDIPLLVEHFIKKFNLKHHLKIKGVDAEAMEALVQHEWPGNIRELENSLERAYIMAKQPTIVKEDLLLSSHSVKRKDQLYSTLPTLEELEKDYIIHVLERTQGVREKAAEILGINRKTLYRKINQYGINA